MYKSVPQECVASVYGYNGGCRNSLHFISETEIVYPVACLVIVLDVDSNQQRYFEGHTNDVLCVAWNERQRLCISGQMDVKGTAGPKACIWSPERPGSFCDLPHPGDARSVSAVGFSPDGQMAVTFTTDDAKTFYIWRNFGREVRKGCVGPAAGLTQIFTASSGRQTTYGIFMFEAACTSSMLTFTTVGDAHFKHWVVNLPQKSPATERQKRGVYGKNPARNPLGWAWRDKDGSAWLVGDNGHLYAVMNHSATASKQLAPNSTPLGCVAKLPDGRWIAGGADGSIYLGSSGPTDHACGFWPKDLQQNLAMVDAIFEWMASNTCIDTSKVFAGGFSYGGYFTQDLACLRRWFELQRRSATVNCTVWTGCHDEHVVESCMVYHLDHEISGHVAPDDTTFLHPASDLDYTTYIFEKFSLRVEPHQIRFYGVPSRDDELWKQSTWPLQKQFDFMHLRKALAAKGMETLPDGKEELRFGQLKGKEVEAFGSTATARFNAVTVSGHLAVFGSSNHALFLIDYVQHELKRVLQVSHTAEAWALDFHPTLSILATASARGGVRFWNVADRKPAVGKVLRSELPTWALAFQPIDGSLLAVGMEKGVLEVMHFPSLQPTFRERLSRAGERISAIRFSPCGRFVAAGSWDQEVYLLSINESQKVALHKILSGNTSSITSVMFSADSHHVMSNSKDCQILHWSVKDGVLEPSQMCFRDTRWQAPWSAVLGWPVVGIWSDPRYDSPTSQLWRSEEQLSFGVQRSVRSDQSFWGTIF
eukprot:g4451.t1